MNKLQTFVFLISFPICFLFGNSCSKESPIVVETPIDTLDTIDAIDTIAVVLPPYYFEHAQKPFPQHTSYAKGVITPERNQNDMDEAVVNYYRKWRTRYLKALNDTQYYVHYTLEYKVGNAISCSEGHGFGMVITALMAGVDTTSYDDFIKLYNYYYTHRSAINRDLMAWQQSTGGINSNGATSATDGDLDIAFSLLLAHNQWGSNGRVNFIEEAGRLIEAIYLSDISASYKTIELGDWVSSGKYAISTRACDFMLDHLRAFSNFTGEAKWHAVIDTTYSIINKATHDSTGLIPDFITIDNGEYVPCEPNFLEGPYDGDYYYNSCRAPWRIAMDYIVYGDSRAVPTLNRINDWIKNKTTNNPSNIKGGYYLAGNAINKWSDMAFTAPFGVSAMVNDQHQEWLNALWDQIINEDIIRGAYFGSSIKMLCIITMSGNWWTPY